MNNSRNDFSLSVDNVSWETKDGRLLSGTEFAKYMKEYQKLNTKITDILSVGDVVMLSYIDVPVTIVETKFEEGPHLYGSDYGGQVEVDDSQIILFNQNEIVEIISKSTKR